MLQYNIPQFVDSEDKVVGPITIRQFAYLAIGVVILGFLWVFKPNIPVFLVFGVPIAVISFALAFVKINGQTFMTFLTNILIYILKPSLFLWSRDINPDTTSVIKVTVQKRSLRPKKVSNEYNQSRVDEIAWTLDSYGQKTVSHQIEDDQPDE